MFSFHNPFLDLWVGVLLMIIRKGHCRLGKRKIYAPIIGLTKKFVRCYRKTQTFKKGGKIIYLAVSGPCCDMWDLVPWPGIEPGPLALGTWSLNHWTTREVPWMSFLANPILQNVLRYLWFRKLTPTFAKLLGGKSNGDWIPPAILLFQKENKICESNQTAITLVTKTPLARCIVVPWKGG